MLIGYGRVSTHDQNLDLQKDAVRGAGCGKVRHDFLDGHAQHQHGTNVPGIAAASCPSQAMEKKTRPWRLRSKAFWEIERARTMK